MRVAVGASSFGSGSAEAECLLQEHGVEIVKNPYGRRLTQEETITHLQGMDGLLAGLEPLNEAVFSACPSLKAIARIGIGMDNVDLEAAARHGIRVSNTPEGPTDAVAEMTMAALLAILHNIVWSNEDVHRGVWKKRLGRSIRELSILMIGYGRIGRKTGDLFRQMGARILVYDKYDREATSCTLEEGLSEADVISLHASGAEKILSAPLFSRMKDGVILLNSARGALIDENALHEALQQGKVSAFWGDALWQEPYSGSLTGCDRAILTPHISTYTRLCRETMELQAARNLLEDLIHV